MGRGRAEAAAGAAAPDANLPACMGVTLIPNPSPTRCQVPRACDLGQVVPQLAALRCFEGVVDLPLAKAAALDPDRVSRLPGEQGRAAQEVRTGGFLGVNLCWTPTAWRACPASRAAPHRMCAQARTIAYRVLGVGLHWNPTAWRACPASRAAPHRRCAQARICGCNIHS